MKTNHSSIESEVVKALDKFKEETEDLWEHFMEGDDPDPQKYDDFLDNAYKAATQSIMALIVDSRVESLQWALNDLNMPDTDTKANLEGFIKDLKAGGKETDTYLLPGFEDLPQRLAKLTIRKPKDV